MGCLKVVGYVLLLTGNASAAGRYEYHDTTNAGAWARILSAISWSPGAMETAGLIVLGQGSSGSPALSDFVQRGAILVLEGESAAAEGFGFRGGAERVRVASVIDARRPSLEIYWKEPLDLPRFSVPGDARVFARERRTGAPLLAGFRQGLGAVLWMAAGPGSSGFERFPYLLQALVDLGLEAPFRWSRLWAFFDSSYRLRADPDFLARQWRSAGISAIHVAAWHYYEPDPGRDGYLKSLIEACHRSGVLVYAWLELPHVSERFWRDHPEWREKTAILEDAELDWRKLMNLADRDCFRAVSEGIESLLSRHDWDGVNVAELYFESLEGAANPSRFTPMNKTIRAEFRTVHGFDPVELFSKRKDDASLRLFLEYRASLARRMQEEWLDEIARIRTKLTHLDVVLTHVDDRLDPRMRDAIGTDAAAVLPLRAKQNFTLLVEDPATVWDRGPLRYPEMSKRYESLGADRGQLGVDINIVERYQDVYPTKQQTGVEVFQLVHLAAASFARVALYFEYSVLPPDLGLLPAAAGVVSDWDEGRGEFRVNSAKGLGVSWQGGALVDGKPWPVRSDRVIWLPGGRHSVRSAEVRTPARVLDFNGDLLSAEVRGERLWLRYESTARAIATFDRPVRDLLLDGADGPVGKVRENVLLLPAGRHEIEVGFLGEVVEGAVGR